MGVQLLGDDRDDEAAPLRPRLPRHHGVPLSTLTVLDHLRNRKMLQFLIQASKRCDKKVLRYEMMTDRQTNQPINITEGYEGS